MVAPLDGRYSFDKYHAPGNAVRSRRRMGRFMSDDEGDSVSATTMVKAQGSRQRSGCGNGAMRRVSLFRAAGIAAVFASGALLAACSSTATTAAGQGTLAVHLTDAAFPTDSVKSVDIFVVRVDARQSAVDSAGAAKGATDDSASTGGWTTLTAPNQSVNLLAYQNGAALPLGQANVAAGSYQGFRLIIDPTKSSLTLKNGTVLSGTSTPNVMFPSAARSGIKIVLAQPISVTVNQTTNVLVDFVVGSSFVMRGNSISQNGLLFTPVIRGSLKP